MITLGQPVSATTATLRVAVLDDDSGFVHVLTKRLEGAGAQYRVLSGPVPAEELAAMKLNALVVDPALLGPLAWDFIERVCGMLPDLGVIVCTQGATLAQRVRGLRLGADDWVSKPWFAATGAGGLARTPGRWSPVTSRSGPIGSRSTSPARAST